MAQWRTDLNQFKQPHNVHLYELGMIATKDGNPVTNTNPFPVSLGGANITISGNVSIISDVTVTNPDTNPVHVHLSEIGNSGILTVDYMPVSGNVIVTSGNVSVVGVVNVGNFPPSQNVVITSGAQNSTFGLDVARGLVPGMKSVFKAGYNPACENNVEESIWSHSVLYPWSGWNSGGTLIANSSSASDTGSLYIVGLDPVTWQEKNETITLNGTNSVATSNSFIRINQVIYNGTSPNAGEIHVYRNGTTVAHINIGAGTAQGAQYTVPAGYTAYIMQGTANIGKGNDGTGYFKYRLYGGSFQRAMTFLLFQSTFDYTFAVPLVLPEKSDLDVTLVSSNAGTAVSCEYGIILIANP